MPITRKEVKKSLFDEPGNPVVLRPRRNATVSQRPDVVNLQRLSSEQFLAELGEGPSPATLACTKALAAKKKKEETLRVQVLNSLNCNVLDADAVDIELSSSNFHDGVDEVVMDKATEVATKDGTKDSGVTLKQKDADSGNVETDGTEAGSNVPTSFTCDASVQTEKLHYLCMCAKCQQVVGEFIKIIQSGASSLCESKGGPLLPKQQDQSFATSCSFRSDTEEYVPLYKGSKIKVSVTTKMQLKSIKSNVVKDYVNVIMNGLYTEVQMSNMTAMGRTKGSDCMSEDVRSAIVVYLNHKFEDVVEATDINDAVNARCYAARRKLWNKDDTEVRKPFLKKGPAAGNDGNSEKKKRSAKKFKSSSSQINELQTHPNTSHKHKRVKSVSPSKLTSKPSKEPLVKYKEKEVKKSKSDRSTTGGKHPKSNEDLKKLVSNLDTSFDSYKGLKGTSTPYGKKSSKSSYEFELKSSKPKKQTMDHKRSQIKKQVENKDKSDSQTKKRKRKISAFEDSSSEESGSSGVQEMSDVSRLESDDNLSD